MNLTKHPFYLSMMEELWVKNMVEEMSVEEKAGQLFVVLGDAYSEEERCQLISQKGIGGVLFRPDTADNIKKKFAQLEALSKLPLLKAANLEEGGSGILKDGTYFGSQMLVAAADELEHTRRFAEVCAREGQQVGVNCTFSPVVDIDYNYQNPITNVRTFGSDKDAVANHASLYVEQLQKLGMAAFAKHFPGDGVDYRDHHLHPTYNDLSAKDWYESFGMIYKRLINEGIYGVMVGHIVQPNVIKDINPEATDADMLPASLSKEMLTGVLREKYGFNGVIITDATIMGGYTMAMPRKDAIPTSIMSGCDMICFSTDIHEDYQYILDAVEDGRLTKERLNEAVMRILALKMRTMSREEAVEPFTFGKKWADDCAQDGVTLAKDIQQLVPFTVEEYPRIKLVTLGNDQMFDGSMSQTAMEMLIQEGFEVELYDPMADDLHGSKNLDKKQLTLILANIPTAVSNKTAVRIFWCEKHAMEIPRFVNEETTAFVSFGNPYHLQDIPRVRTYINAYTATQATVRAVMEKLLGKGAFMGKSPVDVFCGLPDTRL